MKARDNPFSTDRVLRVRYRLRGVAWEELLARLARMRYRAAIVGPDGTGKTTLLEDLEPRLAARGFTPKPLRLDQDHPCLAPDFERQFFAQLGRGDVILLDGAEQMSRWHWWLFRRRSRGAGGLVITSHRAGMLPTVLEARTTPELLEELLEELLGPAATAHQAQARQLFEQHRGNLRLALRAFYDLYADLPQAFPPMKAGAGRGPGTGREQRRLREGASA